MTNRDMARGLVVALAFLAGCSSGSQGEAPSDAGGGTIDGGATGAADGGLLHIDRSGLTNVGTTQALDYGDPNLWVCRPGTDSNPCYGDHGELDATELLPDGSRQVLKHQRATNPKFDCFYVYPTVYLSGSGNQTNLSDDSYVLDALMAQGARMSELCEVYAPLYRQVILSPGAPAAAMDAGSATSAASASDGGAPPPLLSGSAATLALGDVRNAFKYYLDHFNKGRHFVLMGHSQGSGMLIGMMQQDVDTAAAVRSQMISAVLLGGGATTLAAQRTGGTFMNIPTCGTPGETGCVVAYSSFDVTSPRARIPSSASPRAASRPTAPSPALWRETTRGCTAGRTFRRTSPTRSWPRAPPVPTPARRSCSTGTPSRASASPRMASATSRSPTS